MNGKLILVRHSVPEIKKGLPPRSWTLSEEGKLRAEQLAEKLVVYQPQLLASSPEPKALKTAEIVAERLHLPVRVVEHLHEHERSKAGYLSKEAFENAIRAFFENPATLVFGSESANQAFDRFSQAVSAVLAGNESHATVIVSHGTVISLLASRVTGQSGFEIWEQLGLPGFVVLNLESNTLLKLENIPGEVTNGAHRSSI